MASGDGTDVIEVVESSLAVPNTSRSQQDSSDDNYDYDECK